MTEGKGQDRLEKFAEDMFAGIARVREPQEKTKELRTRKQPKTLLSALVECAIDDDLPPDFAKHHDHLLPRATPATSVTSNIPH